MTNERRELFETRLANKIKLCRSNLFLFKSSLALKTKSLGALRDGGFERDLDYNQRLLRKIEEVTVLRGIILLLEENVSWLKRYGSNIGRFSLRNIQNRYDLVDELIRSYDHLI